MRSARAFGASVLALVACLAAAPGQRPDLMMGDTLYAAYLVQGPPVIEQAFPGSDFTRLENFREDFRGRVLSKWERAVRGPKQAMFMLDLALTIQPKRYLMWADYLTLGQSYLAQRPDPIGAKPELDEFELQWDKTVFAMLSGRRQPDLVDEFSRRLLPRITAVAPATGPRTVVDPWIELARGFSEEGYLLQAVARSEVRAAAAVARYAEAQKYESTRAEATVRLARVLLGSDKPAEALKTIETLDETWTREGIVIYWARLIRGKVLDALERPEEAIVAYRGALQIAPNAQAPRVGEMMTEARRNEENAAERVAQFIRTQPDPVIDPWWIYPHGDLRFYQDRLRVLRAMAAR